MEKIGKMKDMGKMGKITCHKLPYVVIYYN